MDPKLIKYIQIVINNTAQVPDTYLPSMMLADEVMCNKTEFALGAIAKRAVEERTGSSIGYLT